MITIETVHAMAGHLRAEPLDDVRSVADEELVALVTSCAQLARQVAAIETTLAGEVASRSRPELGSEGLAARHGKTKPAGLVELLAHVSNAVATARVQLGTQLRSEIQLSGWESVTSFPILAEAMAAGDVDPDAAAAIVRCLQQSERTASANDLAVAERGLVDYAAEYPVAEVSRLARTLRDRLDPNGVLPREEETRHRRGIRIGRERNGIRSITGGLDPEFAAMLEAEFAAANALEATPRFLSDDDRAEADRTASDRTDSDRSDFGRSDFGRSALLDRRAGFTIVTDEHGHEALRSVDPRSREQRQHDVLFGLVRGGIRNVEPGQVRSTADITGVIHLSDLEKLRNNDGTAPGFLTGVDESVSAETIDQLLCDAKFRRALLGNDGEVLALGKTVYPFSAAQRRAILLRDGDTCLMCDSPAAWNDFHHVIPFRADGRKGETDIANGVNLCGPHHRLFHHGKWKLRIRDGCPEVQAPHGMDWANAWRPISKAKHRRHLSDTG